MKPVHRVILNMTSSNSEEEEKVVEAASLTLRERLLRFLLGEYRMLLLLSPGESVDIIEVHGHAPLENRHTAESKSDDLTRLVRPP